MKKPAASFMLSAILGALLPTITPTEGETPSKKTTDCFACKTFADSFVEGILRTEKGTFGGGDTAWEEENRKNYATSELRLTEIQESVCSDVEEGKNLCYSIYGDHEEAIEEWWFRLQEKQPDFKTYFCEEKLKVCCPKGRFDPSECPPCPGYPDDVCSGRGECRENGKCVCDEGYIGRNCEACARKYFDNDFACSPCPSSCEDGICSKSGCTKCSAGWIRDDRNWCVDIDECVDSSKSICDQSEFCTNTEGGFECLPCDPACEGCYGEGPDKCQGCAEGYEMAGEYCVETAEIEEKMTFSIVNLCVHLGVCTVIYVVYKRRGAMVAFGFSILIGIGEHILTRLLS